MEWVIIVLFILRIIALFLSVGFTFAVYLSLKNDKLKNLFFLSQEGMELIVYGPALLWTAFWLLGQEEFKLFIITCIEKISR